MADVPFGRGAPLPSGRALPVYPIWWAKPGQPSLDLTLIDESWDAYWVHWIPPETPQEKGHDRLCLEDGEGCPYHTYTLKWVGYIACYHHDERRRGGLVVTPQLARDLVTMAHPLDGLFAQRVGVTHMGRTTGGGVRARRSEKGRAVTDPQRISLQETLRILWRLPKSPNELLAPLGRKDLIPFPEANPNDRYGLGEARGGVR